MRCPVGQAQQWHTALRERGVPTRLVLYPDASHLFILLGTPSQRIDFNRRVVDWVEQHAVHGGRAARSTPRTGSAGSPQLAERHKVPGAALGILRLARTATTSWSRRRTACSTLDTGAPATTDSVFQIGSITKVWTATVVMQLVDEGLLDLDTPVVEVLPELRLADPDVTKSVTDAPPAHPHQRHRRRRLHRHRPRRRLPGEVRRRCSPRPAQNHPLGATWSYCNSGFSLLGRVIEKLTGGTWDQALRDRLFTPARARPAPVTLPEEALLHRAAVGHVDDERRAGRWRPRGGCRARSARPG